MGWTWLAQDKSTVSGSCENYFETSGHHLCGGFDQMSDCHLLNKDVFIQVVDIDVYYIYF
jgi:hypothetical protein